MIKKIITCLLLVLPIIVKADCDYSTQVKYSNLANNIIYETEYSKSKGTFSIHLYNMINSLYVTYNNETYYGDNNFEVTIPNIKEGSYVTLKVGTIASGCVNALKNFKITLPYYNEFYNSSKCKNYKDKLTICSSEFLSYKATDSLLESAIKNYTNPIIENPNENKSKMKVFLESIIKFASDFGLKIALVAGSSAIAIAIYRAKYRKVKHGI